MGRAFRGELAVDELKPVGFVGRLPVFGVLALLVPLHRAVGVGAEPGYVLGMQKSRGEEQGNHEPQGCSLDEGLIQATISEIGFRLSWNLSAFTSTRCSIVSSRLLRRAVPATGPGGSLSC